MIGIIYNHEIINDQMTKSYIISNIIMMVLLAPVLTVLTLPYIHESLVTKKYYDIYMHVLCVYANIH